MNVKNILSFLALATRWVMASDWLITGQRSIGKLVCFDF